MSDVQITVVGAGGGGSLASEHADLALALAVHAGIRSPFGLTVEEQKQITRALALAESIHGPKELCEEHDWPAELDSDAKCGRCGLEYGQWMEKS